MILFYCVLGSSFRLPVNIARLQYQWRPGNGEEARVGEGAIADPKFLSVRKLLENLLLVGKLLSKSAKFRAANLNLGEI